VGHRQPEMIEHRLAPPPRPQERRVQCPSYPGIPAENTENTESSHLRVGKEMQLTRGSSSQRCWSLLLLELFREMNMKGTAKGKVEPAYRGGVREERAVAKMCIHSVIFTKRSLARITKPPTCAHSSIPNLKRTLTS